jgi:hypothetical protein
MATNVVHIVNGRTEESTDEAPCETVALRIEKKAFIVGPGVAKVEILAK